MKADVHPKWHPDALITCACGAEFRMGTTIKDAKIAICSNCHPFFTGQQKLIDTEGRVNRFRRRYNLAEA